MASVVQHVLVHAAITGSLSVVGGGHGSEPAQANAPSVRPVRSSVLTGTVTYWRAADEAYEIHVTDPAGVEHTLTVPPATSCRRLNAPYPTCVEDPGPAHGGAS